MKNIYCLIVLALLAGLPGRSQIAAWDFYGQSLPVTCAATTFHPGLVTSGGAGNITRGPGAPASGGVNSFRTTGFQNNGISTAATDYFQVTLQPVSGFKLSLLTIDAKFNGTSTFFAAPGVTSQFAYSLDGVNFTLIGSPVQSVSLTMTQVSLAGIPDLQNVYEGTTVTLRYYASGQTTTGGWGFYSAAPGTNGLAIGGTVTPAVIAVPVIQASGITFINIGQNQLGLAWTPGSGEKRVVKVNTSNVFTDPANGSDPTANPAYSGSGEQVVYNYSGTSIPAVTSLTAGTTYWFRVYEYNGSGTLTMYNVSGEAGNPGSQATSGVLLPPAISSTAATGITAGSAMLGGHITHDGGSPVTERGTAWDTVSPVTLSVHALAEGGTDTGYFSHVRTGLPPARQIFYAAYATNASGSSLTAESAFFTLATEPQNHVTAFTATAAGTTSIGLSWNPVSPGADGYLILQKPGNTDPLWVPADATLYPAGSVAGDATVAAVVTPGSAGSVTITGLSPGTSYSFNIFPYAWDGVHAETVNYLTLPPVPVATATTATPSVATYHWTGATGTDWNAAGNWDPVRSIPALNDILVFDMGGLWTIVNVPPQTIGQLKVLQNTAITLQGTGTLVIAGDAGEDLDVAATCQLNISGTNALTILLAGGASGLVSGSVAFLGGGHRLLAGSAGGITFSSGSIFRAGNGFTGNPFGTVNLNTFIFTAGSAYICQAGGNPFGAAAPASVVVFQPGSLFRLDAYAVPSFGGRTYGDFEMNYPGSVTATGSSAVTIGNFTASQGTFYFNVTGNPGHAIRGNVSIASVATLIFSPSSAGNVVLNGSSPQTISGTGSLMAGSNSTLTIGNSAGVTLVMDATLNNLTISPAGVFTVAPAADLTVSGNLVVQSAATGLILEPGASLIHHTPGVAGTVKRSLGAAGWSDPQDGWHLLSSPVAGQLIGETGGFVTTGTGNDYDFYTWWEPGQKWVNFKNTTLPPTFVTLNGSTGFEAGKGYLCAYQQAGEKIFSGVLNVNDVVVESLTLTGNVSGNRGWHLLGNPFTSALAWYDGWPASNIGGVAYTWNEAGMSYTPRNAGEEIPACNGFMVQVTGTPGTTGSLTIPASSRIHGTQTFYKEQGYPVVQLFARNTGNGSFQECQIRFNPLSSEGYDPEFDGRFLPGYAPLFYSAWEGEKLAVNALPASSEERPVPLYFQANAGDRCRIDAQLSDVQTLPVFLVDRQAGIAHDLADDPDYDFIAGAGDDPMRFEISFGSRWAMMPPGSDVKVWFDGSFIRVYHAVNVQVEVYGIHGTKLLRQQFAGSGTDKFRPDVPGGFYVVRVIAGSRIETTKILIHS